MSCIITPITAFQSTNLNSKIDCFNRLGERIVRSLGAPVVTVELAQDQLFENISIACELFTKYAGYTREYLVFDSRLYETGKGIRLDHLFTLSNGNLTFSEKIKNKTLSNNTSFTYDVEKSSFIVNYPLNSNVFANNSALSADLSEGLSKNQILDESTYQTLTSNFTLSCFFQSASTLYITSSAFHDCLYDIPSSNFSGVLSTYEVQNGDTLSNIQYASLSNNVSNLILSSFFIENNQFALVKNDIPVTVFLSNNTLSGIFDISLSAFDIIPLYFNTLISSNLSSGIPIEYYFVDNLSGYHVTTTKILSSIFIEYPTLSSTFSYGLSVGQLVNNSQYSLLTSVGNFSLSSIFYSGYKMMECTTAINSAIFLDNILSSSYVSGINLGDVFLSTNIPSQDNIFFGTLSSLNLSITKFFNSYTLSSENIQYNYTLLNSIPHLFLSAGTILTETSYSQLSTTDNNIISSFFTPSYNKELVSCGQKEESPSVSYNNMFDYDLMSYRKVMEITDFEEGSTTGINTLFTIEQTLAQQTYFSYAMGNYGFDLISWYAVKQWLETREKVLAIRRSYDFNPQTQIFRLYPEPNPTVSTFYGILPCYVEAKLENVIKEQWVYQYALALCKIVLARNRGKYANAQMFGGQTFDTSSILQEGITEKKELEEKLYTGAVAGFGDGDFIGMYIG